MALTGHLRELRGRITRSVICLLLELGVLAASRLDTASYAEAQYTG